MNILILGIVIFFGIHLLPGMVNLRQGFVERLGEKGYQGVYSLISLAGFILIVYGKSKAEFQHLWQPPGWGMNVAPVLMVFAFVSLTAAYMPSNLKRFTRHPMLWGVTFWSAAHLLTNGDLASLLLFGSFGLFSLYDMYSANSRGASKQETVYPVSKDIITAVTGVVAYAVVLFAHSFLFGVAVI
ncbi:MAG: NnrU family protein [Arenicella sp.]|nr:NnrU family protein [Arenicella sp.]